MATGTIDTLNLSSPIYPYDSDVGTGPGDSHSALGAAGEPGYAGGIGLSADYN